MARVQAAEIVDHLSNEFRKALDDAVKKNIPDAEYDARKLFRDFVRDVDRRCSNWEQMPDR